jgi:hypothetical protein
MNDNLARFSTSEAEGPCEKYGAETKMIKLRLNFGIVKVIILSI